MIKVAFTGAQGVGKTTILEAVQQRLTRDGHVALALPELIRECPYPADRESTFNTQLWISAHTIMRETDLLETAEFVLVDRPITDIAVYKELVKANKGLTYHQDVLLTEIINSWKSTYQMFFHITVPIEEWRKRDIDDGFRSTDEAVYRFLTEGFAKAAPEGHHHIENISLEESVETAYTKVKRLGDELLRKN
ncbi:MAG TPA: AAA family ATPase [candidate division Zixibacteria bacterium]|nr:AAA family ATPase [candidate division Zixibacteria bacterium]